MDFRWHPDERPPPIEPHSKAKLDVLRSYLRAYFDRLNVSPNREEFKLDLVDGFAGGGTFTKGNVTISGTPLIMLEESKAAITRLNRNRKKPLNFDCKFYFVDKDAAHTDHLRKILKELGYAVNGEEIVVRNSPFEEEVDNILTAIRSRQPRAGRAIFLLDQTGFSQVSLGLVNRIFRELASAEVILTFAADALLNHRAMTPAYIKMLAPLEFTESKVEDLIQLKNGDGGRALAQRILRDHIRSVTNVPYDTPFFIRPHQSRRALWFLHLSRHPTARDVMIQRHWELQNRFEHYGSGDFAMLGWDALRSETLPLFNFKEKDAEQMRVQLLESIPAELFSLVSEGPISVDTMHHSFANRTAARFSDLDETLLKLSREEEFVILGPDGKPRSRSLARLQATDRIALSDRLLFPGLSRLPSTNQKLA